MKDSRILSNKWILVQLKGNKLSSHRNTWGPKYIFPGKRSAYKGCILWDTRYMMLKNRLNHGYHKERKAMVAKSRKEGMNGQSLIHGTDSVLPDAVFVQVFRTFHTKRTLL